ncbi:glycosyltransferase family 2 protein [uncultured Tateyamaria sp.]|uniref:glycosyltransferase family 2 protein n=1 Tax=uncultured Tateyamaria sp. TaxID=455651 RepID=UPI00263A088A|nr:glycosyltransferase family 2 protein [uncultured Tateyamaria sp.]
MTTWGLAATILAPPRDTLRFAAYHLDLGAHRLYIYLDADTPDAYNTLKSHPKIRVQTCDEGHWKRLCGKRPDKHQVRQTANATHAYNRRAEVDWLIHMDADEFLVPDGAVTDALATVPADVTSARVRPMELLGGSADAFKAFIPADGQRRAVVEQIYPTYGTHLKGGFLSHVAGKLFVRSGLDDISVRIHNAFQGDDILPDAAVLADIALAHCHAKSWEDWQAAYAYRLDKGSYRSELKPATKPEQGGLSLHDLFRSIEAEAGTAGLRAFYDEVVGDSADLRARLEAHGLLRIAALDLDGAVARHFPDVTL